MASSQNQGMWAAADAALVERQVSDWEDSCALVWRDWLAALMVAQLTQPETRVSWH
jgi:hypothetical protein